VTGRRASERDSGRSKPRKRGRAKGEEEGSSHSLLGRAKVDRGRSSRVLQVMYGQHFGLYGKV
jgi:hypothetical protein